MKEFILYVTLFINFTSLAFYFKNKWDLQKLQEVQLRDSTKHQIIQRPPSCREKKQNDHTRVLILLLCGHYLYHFICFDNPMETIFPLRYTNPTISLNCHIHKMIHKQGYLRIKCSFIITFRQIIIER